MSVTQARGFWSGVPHQRDGPISLPTFWSQGEVSFQPFPGGPWKKVDCERWVSPAGTLHTSCLFHNPFFPLQNNPHLQKRA